MGTCCSHLCFASLRVQIHASSACWGVCYEGQFTFAVAGGVRIPPGTVFPNDGQLVRIYEDSSGMQKVSGSQKLTESQHYPPQFGQAMLEPWANKKQSKCRAAHR